MPLLEGTRFGSYEIVAPVGAGGMGEVYKARDTRLDRHGRHKVLRPAFRRTKISASGLSGRRAGLVAERVKRGALPVEQVLR
jgi:serine/threonine protein kinase